MFATRDDRVTQVSAEEPMSVDETESLGATGAEDKRVQVLAESVRTMQQQQSAMASCLDTLMVTVQTIFLTEKLNSEGKIAKNDFRTRSRSFEETKRVKSDSQDQISSTDLEPVSVVSDVKVISSQMKKKNKTEILKEF